MSDRPNILFFDVDNRAACLNAGDWIAVVLMRNGIPQALERASVYCSRQWQAVAARLVAGEFGLIEFGIAR